MRIFLLALAAAVIVLSSGCASITTGTTQPLTVTTKQSGNHIVGASCHLTNGKGTYYVTTPGTVTVTRSFSDMIVVCKKDPLPDANMTVKSSVKGMAFGNILIGGVIVDTSTGAAYDYPTSFELEMGKSVLIGARTDAVATTSDAKSTDAVQPSPTAVTPAPATSPAQTAPTVSPTQTPTVTPSGTVSSLNTALPLAVPAKSETNK